NRRRASLLVRPFAASLTEVLTSTGAATLGTSRINAGVRFSLNKSVINASSNGKFDDHRPRQRKIFACDFALHDGVSADFPQIYLVGLSISVRIVPKIFELLFKQFLVNRAMAGSDIGRTQLFRIDQPLKEFRIR